MGPSCGLLLGLEIENQFVHDCILDFAVRDVHFLDLSGLVQEFAVLQLKVLPRLVAHQLPAVVFLHERRLVLGVGAFVVESLEVLSVAVDWGQLAVSH